MTKTEVDIGQHAAHTHKFKGLGGWATPLPGKKTDWML